MLPTCNFRDLDIILLLFEKLYFFLKTLFERERKKEQAHTQVGRGAEGEANFPLSRELDNGLDPGTLGS